MLQKKFMYLLLIGMLLVVPVPARAGTPEEQIDKLKKDLQKAQKEIETLRAELYILRMEKWDREEKAQWERSRKELERLIKEHGELRKDSEQERQQERQRFSLGDPLLPGQQLWDPPPRYMLRTPIKGTITGVADDLAIISIGGDHGIEVDQVLNVYRLEPTPESLGTLKIIIVDTHRAAGRFTPATKSARMQKGDKVRTNIAGGEKSWD